MSPQASKPQLRRWIDTVGEVYAKLVIAATFAALIILPLAGVPMLSANGQRGAFYRAMGLLTTASPCALVLVPLAYVSAIAAITSRSALLVVGLRMHFHTAPHDGRMSRPKAAVLPLSLRLCKAGGVLYVHACEILALQAPY